MAHAVAINVIETVTISSPGPTSRQRKARCSALVPLFRLTQLPTPQYAANLSSNSVVAGPWAKLVDSQISSNALNTSLRRGRYCARRSKYGTVSIQFD